MLHFLWSKQLLTRQWHSLSIFSKWTNRETVTLSAAETIYFFAKVLPFKYILITSAFMPLLRGQAWNCYLVSAHCAARSFLESLFRFFEKNRTKKTLKRIDARAQNLLCIVFHPFVFCDAKSCHLTENLVVCELLKDENKVSMIWRPIEIYSILGENPGRFVNSCEEMESALNLKHQIGGSQANQPGESKEYIIQGKVNSQRTKYSDSDDIFVCGWKKVRFIVCSFNLHFEIENIISAQIHRQCLTFFGWYQNPIFRLVWGCITYIQSVYDCECRVDSRNILWEKSS